MDITAGNNTEDTDTTKDNDTTDNLTAFCGIPIEKFGVLLSDMVLWNSVIVALNNDRTISECPINTTHSPARIDIKINGTLLVLMCKNDAIYIINWYEFTTHIKHRNVDHAFLKFTTAAQVINAIHQIIRYAIMEHIEWE